MTTPENNNLATRRSRVVLYAPCYPDAESAMDLAIELARQIDADLQGVLVHDKLPLSTARDTVSAVVSYSGVRATGVTMMDMLNAFRADARRFRATLQRLAQQAALPAGFQEAEGRLTDAMSATAEASDLVVIGFKPLLKRRDDLVVVLEEGRPLPEFARTLANRLNKRLVRLNRSAGQTDLLARLDRMSPTAVILAGEDADLPSLARIVEAARCPVIVSRLPQ